MDNFLKTKDSQTNKYTCCIYYVTRFCINKLMDKNKTLSDQKTIVMKPQLICVVQNDKELKGEIPN
jgi:hypothetical protein